jgi:hypothetical protein
MSSRDEGIFEAGRVPLREYALWRKNYEPLANLRDCTFVDVVWRSVSVSRDCYRGISALPECRYRPG